EWRMNGDLRENCRLLDEKLHRAVNPDMHVRFFRTFSRDAAVYYVDGLISTDFMQHYLLSPLQNAAETASSGEIAGCIRQRVALCEVEAFFDVREIVAQLVSGHAVVLTDGMDGALSFDVRGAVRRGISPPLTESVVRGPHQGFNESIRDSITLLRRILPTPELIGEMRQIGDAIPVSLCVMYLQNAVDESSLSRLKARLEEVHIDHVLSIGALEQLLEDHPFSLLPQCVMTERPDRAASMLLEGQIVLLLDGSPQVLVLPASLLHLLHTPDDTSSRWLYGTFMRLIRLLGLLCALMLPALFVAFVTFHPSIRQRCSHDSESQAEVPLSVPLEMLLMLIMVNLVGEASIRVPSLTGSTLGTVSGLILGQAAVEAKLVHPLLIIVVAVSSLGSYAVPDYSLGLAVRIGQLLLLAAGSIFGVYGIVLFMTALCVRLCSLTSLGAPFAAPLSPPRVHNPDLLTRHRWQRWRTWLGSAENNTAHRQNAWRDRRGQYAANPKRRAGRGRQNALIGLLSAVSMCHWLRSCCPFAGAPRGGFLPRVCCRGCASTALFGCSCAERTRGR
ncbi:MAG: spore germination protein, partial [Christensenellales bacterium]